MRLVWRVRSLLLRGGMGACLGWVEAMLRQFRSEPRFLEESPEVVAASLRHLPGFVWLDTAGRCPEPDRDGAVSIMAACATRVVRGHIGDVSVLEEQMPGECGGGQCGWFGWVDYEGGWEFGWYEQVLVYRHATGEWLECGDLLSQRREGPAGEVPRLEWVPGIGEADYCRMVSRAQEYIGAGDIYQVNLAHRFAALWPAGADPFALYLKLREVSPAPCAAYMAGGERTVLSSSPESFLRMSGRSIRTRPIKGTRPRFADSVRDERSRGELLSSPKERAELVMITDLLRNDLGMVCEYGSVRVTGLLQPEAYEQVHHLVSTVEGTLRGDVSHAAALKACFPGGSITGAPKKRAVEIIRELEPVPRGLYTGAIGYFGATGDSHFSIAIRTMVLERGVISCHAGAGIVADSSPAAEWEETLQKASGMLAAGRSR